jgi:hypothetical protein
VAWTTPRTWAASDVPTASTGATALNAQVRDNLNVLKTPLDDNAKVTALNSATVADLSGANLTGVAKLASDNTYSGGAHDHSAARFRAPVGTDKSAGVGSLWVSGNYLHFIDDGGLQKRYLGSLIHTDAAALSGSVWVEGDNFHYVDEAGGDERRVPRVAGAHTDAAARGGSVWLDTDDHVHWVSESGSAEQDGHEDVAAHSDSHSDVAHSDTHSDVAHSDTSHNDSHSDIGHDDTHSDAGHADGHGDHNDGGHGDGHGDAAHTDTHSDGAHADSHSDASHSDSHTDTHSDSHTDSHGDHSDTHADQPETVP